MRNSSKRFGSVMQVVLLWIAGLVAAGQFAKISVVFDAYRAHYPEAGSTFGFLVSLLSFVGIFLGLVFGTLVITYGMRRALIAGLLLGALLSLYQSTVPPFPWMLLSRVAEGLSHLAIVVAAPTLIARLAHERLRPLALTLWSTFFGVSFALSALIAPDLVERSGTSSLLLLHALLMGIAAVAVRWFLPEDTENTISTEKNGLAPGPRSLWQLHARTYQSPAIAAPALGWLAYTTSFVALLTVFPPLLPADIRQGVALLLPLLSIGISLTLGAWLLKRHSAVNVVIVGFAAATLAAVGFASENAAPIAAVMLFCCFGLVQSGSFTAVAELNRTSESRALANGAMAQMGNLGNTIGTPLLLGLHTAYATTGIAVGLILCYGAAVALHLLFRRQREQASEFRDLT